MGNQLEGDSFESPCHMTHSHINYKLKFNVIADIMMIMMLVV